MMDKKRTRILTLAILLLATTASLPLHAQNKQPQWTFSAHTGMGYLINTFEAYDQMLESPYYPIAALRIGYQTTETDHPYAPLYGYPNVGFQLGWSGLSVLHYTGESHFSSIFAFCGFIERDFLRLKRFSFGYEVQTGIGFNKSVYNTDTNPLNMNMSSSLLFYVGGDLKMRYRFNKCLEMGLSFHLEHYSTGDLSCPNLGISSEGAVLSLRYSSITPPPIDHNPQPKPEVKPFLSEVYFGGGLHKCHAEWAAFGSTRPWPILVVGGGISYRYLPQISTGVHLDLNNADPMFVKRVEQVERVLYGDEAVDAYGRYSTFSCGISLIQQFHYGNFSVYGHLGIYLYKHTGLHEQEGLLYQRAGIKYTFPQLANVFVAVDCKAHHFNDAAMMELTVGKRF